MSQRRSIFAVAVFLVIVAIAFWLYRQDSRKPSQAGNTPPAAAAPAIAIDNTASAPVAPTPSSPPPQTKRHAMQTVLQLLNHKPIEFYGRVLDQDEEPVADVDVYASVIYNTGAAGGSERKQTKTDGNGTFVIQGMTGRTLGIGLEKEGYEYGGGQGPFQYTEMVGETERHHPDRNKPVVFHLWKLQGPEPLVEGNKTFRVPSDGIPVQIDLRAGKVVDEGGDLILSLRYQQTKSGPFKWTLDLQAPEGGLRNAEQRVAAMFAAPNEGYESSIQIRMEANSPAWRQAVDRSFYLKTGSGNFGKLSLSIGTNRADPFGIATLRWWLNPRVGSRVLEPKQTEQAPNP